MGAWQLRHGIRRDTAGYLVCGIPTFICTSILGIPDHKELLPQLSLAQLLTTFSLDVVRVGSHQRICSRFYLWICAGIISSRLQYDTCR